MAHHDVQTGLNPTRFDNLKRILSELENELRFTVKRTPAEIRALSPVGNRRFPFVEKGVIYAQDFAHLMPAFRSVPNFVRVKFDREVLTYVKNRLAIIMEKVGDTDKQVSSNYYDYGLMFYEMVTNAASGDQPGTAAVRDDLKQLFERTPSDDLPEGDANNGDAPDGNSDQLILGNEKGDLPA